MRFATIFAAVSSLAAVASAVPTTVDLEGRTINVADIINKLGIGLVKKINTYITLDTFETDLVYVTFDIKNPLPIELTLDRVSANASLNGTVYASFDYKFPKPLTVKPLATKNSGEVPNVKLVQGLAGSLDIVPKLILDLETNAEVRAATIAGKLGIPLKLNGLKQSSVPTSYDITL